ncbi:hypothetical protein I2708_001773 [Vibrio parahaemolyticus]|nr:hypothetical protein [Vibrio parahaemolyticus]
MSSSWYRRGTVTVTDGSKEIVGVGTLWVDAGNKPLAGDIMFIAGSIYEVESITDNEHLSLFRPFTGVPPANGEYAIIRNTSVTIATRVAAMVAAAINSKQVLLDDLRGYYTSTADKVLIHTDDGSTIEVVPLQTLVSDITNLIAQSESIKNDLANTQAALDLVRQYSNAAQGVEVEPGKYSAKSYAADAADTLALVNKAKSDVDLKASQVQQTKTDIEQFVSTSKTEIDAKATAISTAIATQATTVKGEITTLVTTSKSQISAQVTTGKSDIAELITGGTDSISSLSSTSQSEITALATTEKAAISQQSTAAISEMTSLKQSAEQAASTATQKATQAAASATSAAQSKTDAQTLKTQTEALANETKQVAEEIKSGSYVGWQIYCQSEANMKAARMLASEQFAASGFVNYGKHSSQGHTVNEGVSCYYSGWAEPNTNRLWIGRGKGASYTTGNSKTDFPVTHIAGFISNILGIGDGYNGASRLNSIKFPEAPNGAVVYDSTGNCRGSGKVTLDLTKDVDPKYDDVAANTNEAVARAFEGVCANGDFRFGNDERYWRSTSATITTSGATLTNHQDFIYNFDTKLKQGVKYEIETLVDLPNGSLWADTSNSVGRNIKLNNGYTKAYITPAVEGRHLAIRVFDNTSPCVIKYVAIREHTEEVVINRVDMFGFEYFLEEISKANPFVYPYGCIQSKLTSIEGVATKESNRPITYYSVFDGDTTSKGKGVDFWAATDAQKRALVSNPEHNIYLLDDGRLVQWRVRQRTIAGVGNGDWQNVNSQGAALMFFQAPSGFTIQPSAQGMLDVTPTWFESGVSKGAYYGITHSTPIHTDNGIFRAGLGGKAVPTLGVDGHCYFLVCGVVPRLNQGSYHPSLNPMGARQMNNDINNTGARDWWNSNPSVATARTSTVQCMKVSMGFGEIAAHPNTGKIGGTSGRPDGKFYDAIYASGQGGVIDYRLSAWDMSSKEEASKVFQKVVNGSYRGEESLVFTKRVTAGGAGGTTSNPNGFYLSIAPNAQGGAVYIEDSVAEVGDTLRFYDNLGDLYIGVVSKKTSAVRHEILLKGKYFPYTLPSDFTNWYMVTEVDKGSSVSGEFTMVDVIGDPANILATPALANGWLGGWIPVIPTGSSLNFPLSRKGLVQGRTQWTSDSGASWNDATTNYNTTLNSIVGAAIPAIRVQVYTYTAFAKQTKGSTNKPVLNSAGGIGAVAQSGGYHAITWGALLVESLIGKVPTSSVGGAGMSLSDWINIPIQHDGKIHVGDLKKVEPFDKPRPNNDSPAVKALWYQSATNQQCSLNFAWNELVYKLFTNPIVDTGAQMLRKRGAIYLVNVAGSALNGRLVIWNGNEASIPVDYTAYYVDANNVIKSKSSNAVSTIQLYTGDGWGDDSTIRIIDGIGTFINLNGDTCLYGTHELAIPYGYTKNKARAGSQVSGGDL